MEEINDILALFDSREKWTAFIDLSNKRDALVNELHTRLTTELEKIANERLNDSGWNFCADRNGDGQIYMYPKEISQISIMIETRSWEIEWYRRCASIYVYEPCVKNIDVFNRIKECIPELPMAGFQDNKHNSPYHLFVKQIPATVFNVESHVKSYDECLYMAADNAQQLAKNIWEEVFQPFANKDLAERMAGFIIP